ncbi:HipA N-terminal domain-containing protein [Xanthomonas translucens pv. poae]|uniref:HipA N-terminal domain-containing protein n=1 Tax=Xanthomonas graminis pv. poae TaxID=227946 RepID=A0A0K3ACI2_9XANT|nr:HipA domain-containing protein [Xanthomonas translucens]UKE63127.1 HipA domain-containing protein [Xanthomonas translucens pv. poae]CTP93210.1 HipA N-terminal domain-containing protein [Xanthomonas translucens pv. poae]
MSRPPQRLHDAIGVTVLDGLHYPQRSLLASIGTQRVGTLSEYANLWKFTYAPAWLASADRFALAPGLPLQEGEIQDGSSFRPVQWYFDNLLPEEAQRQLMAADAGIPGADAFALLSYYGAESAGSLTLLPPGKSLEAGGMAELSDAQLSARIRDLPHHSLAAGAAKRMSLAGAQHKLAVIERDGRLLQPIGAEPSTHILKPENTSGDYPHSVANEWFVMRLAARAGLDVPPVQRRYVPEPAFLIERFDRQRTATGVRRVHAIDACQLLGLDRSFKYQMGSVEALARIAALCRNKLATRFRLYRWLIFNVLTGNSDAHLKNLSFLVGPDGVNLAPHYDLLCTTCYDSRAYGSGKRPEHATLAWPILGVERFGEVNFAHLVQAGEAMGLPRKAAANLLELQRSAILDEAQQLLNQVDAENAQLLKHTPDLDATLAGEMRCLRAITHNVVKEMAERLSPR